MDRNSDPMIGRTIAKYEILSVLGGGGMGTVYRARQTGINRDVAIKIINIDLKGSEQFIKRFQREAQAIAALEHPHIIPVIDYGQEGDLTYLVMALKVGGDLGILMKRERQPLNEVYRYVSQIASALDYAHVRGIIHRDLKPANVLLDEERNTFLTDFGIAKKLGETKLTAQGMVVGSPIYMAPEAWRGEDAGPETDIYSLGVILFEMLCGQTPFADKVPARLMLKHISEAPPSVLQFRPDLTPYIDQVVQQSLAKDRTARFTSAAMMAQMLKAALARSGTGRLAPPQPKPPIDETNVEVAPVKGRSQPVGGGTPYPLPQRPAPPQQPVQSQRQGTGGLKQGPTPYPPPQRPAPPQQPVQSQRQGTGGLGQGASYTPLGGQDVPAVKPAGGLMENKLVLFGMGGIILLLVVVIVILLVSR